MVINQNAVSCKNYGVSDDVSRKYSYADVAGARYSCPILEYLACERDRSLEGSTYVHSPPFYRQGPTIATLITQYGVGHSIEENTYAQKLLRTCPQESFTNRLRQDTTENRITYFNRSLFKLSVRMKSDEFDHVKTVVIPVGIGRRGKADEVWLTRYLPIISIFAEDIDKSGKECGLICNESYLKFLERKSQEWDINSNVKKCFMKIKDLPIMPLNDLCLNDGINENLLESVCETQCENYITEGRNSSDSVHQYYV